MGRLDHRGMVKARDVMGNDERVIAEFWKQILHVLQLSMYSKRLLANAEFDSFSVKARKSATQLADETWSNPAS